MNFVAGTRAMSCDSLWRAILGASRDNDIDFPRKVGELWIAAIADDRPIERKHDAGRIEQFVRSSVPQADIH